jgi:serine/threonine-protein kinase
MGLPAPPPSLLSLRPDAPRELGALVEAALVKDRDRRIPNVAELSRGLVPFAPEVGRYSAERIAGLLSRSGALPMTATGARARGAGSGHGQRGSAGPSSDAQDQRACADIGRARLADRGRLGGGFFLLRRAPAAPSAAATSPAAASSPRTPAPVALPAPPAPSGEAAPSVASTPPAPSAPETALLPKTTAAAAAPRPVATAHVSPPRKTGAAAPVDPFGGVR